MDLEKQKIYHPGIDVLRIIAILAVIAIHTTSRVLEASSFDIAHSPVTFSLNQIARFAVPLFFMISGFVLEVNYPFHTSYLTYIKKRLGKIFLPYLFWSAVYFFFIYTNHTNNFLQVLLTGDASYQLYFIPTLLIFYLLFPLVHKYYKTIATWWGVNLLAICEIVLLFYDYTFHPFSFYHPGSIALLNFFPFILGAIASHHQQRMLTLLKKWKYFLLLIVCLLGGYIVFEGIHGYLKTHDYLSFYSQWRPSVLFYTILLGALLFYFSNKEVFHRRVIKYISRLSFFVFFVHVIVLETMWNLIWKKLFYATHNSLQQLWYDLFFFMVVASLSFLIALFFEKIPIVRKITG